jgi:hypothetical protein
MSIDIDQHRARCSLSFSEMFDSYRSLSFFSAKLIGIKETVSRLRID